MTLLHSSMDYKSLYEEQLKKNEQLTKELNLHKMNTDELTNVYERVGELVGNTNLPRHEEQLIIEFKKLQDHFNLLIELIQGVESEEQLKQLKQLPLLV